MAGNHSRETVVEGFNQTFDAKIALQPELNVDQILDYFTHFRFGEKFLEIFCPLTEKSTSLPVGLVENGAGWVTPLVRVNRGDASIIVVDEIRHWDVITSPKRKMDKTAHKTIK